MSGLAELERWGAGLDQAMVRNKKEKTRSGSEDMKRQGKLSASLEDYLEAIYVSQKKHGVARSKDIMERLGVSGPSVTEALRLLSDRELINYSPYAAITMTDEGESIARDILHRHESIRDFFMEVLGLTSEIANEGACKMEHIASSSIIERMISYTAYVRECDGGKGCGHPRCFAEYFNSTRQSATIKE